MGPTNDLDGDNILLIIIYYYQFVMILTITNSKSQFNSIHISIRWYTLLFLARHGCNQECKVHLLVIIIIICVLHAHDGTIYLSLFHALSQL